MNAIQTYGSNSEIQQMAGRFRVALRGGDKLTNNEATALAQIAAITGLNPFTGELWYIPGKGPMVGIAGARRLWADKGKAGGGHSFIEILPCSPEEAGASEKDVVVAFKAVAHDSAATAEYQKIITATIDAMRAGGSKDPYGDAKEICGPRPQWIGYGYSTHSETSRMNKTQLARKRAEADALKKCIVIPFGAAIDTQDSRDSQPVEYIEAEATDVMSIEAAAAMETSKGNKYGTLTSDQLTKIINHPAATNAQKEAALLCLSALSDPA
jgi:hypothetical protein